MPDSRRVRFDPENRLNLQVRRPGGRWVRLHSKIDPAAEAVKSLTPHLATGKPPLVITIGLGLGFLLDAIESHSPGTRVLAIEPLPEALPALEASRSWARWQRDQRLTLLVGPHYAGAGEAWKLVDPANRPPVIVHPVLARAFPEAVRQAQDLADRLVFGAQSNADARRRFAPTYLLNTLRNLQAIAASHDVQELFGAFSDVPAVIVSAGPSLDANIGELRACSGRVLMIAVDTALRPLLAAGVRPQLTVAVDPSPANARHLEGLTGTQATWFVAEGSVDPVAFRAFGRRVLAARVSDHAPWSWLQEIGVGRGTLRAWGSVATTALDLAIRAGCNPIVFAGQDLAFTDRRPYCRGTVYQDDWSREATDGRTLRDVWEARLQAQSLVEVEGVDGRPALTTRTLLAFRDWLAEQALVFQDRRFVNGTGAGILRGPRIQQLPLGEAVADRRPRAVVAPLNLEPLPPGAAWRERGLRELLEALVRGTGPSVSTVEAWIAWTSGQVTKIDLLTAILEPFRVEAAADVALLADAVRFMVDLHVSRPAAALLRQFVELAPDVAEWHYLLAYCLHRGGLDPEAALPHYGHALRLGRRPFWVLLHRASLLHDMGDVERARGDFDSLLRLPVHEQGGVALLAELQAKLALQSSGAAVSGPEDES